MCGKHFQIYGVHFPRKCIDDSKMYRWFEAFLLMPVPTQNSPSSSCHHVRG